MPRIEEYLPQTEATGPTGGTSPNLDQINAVGRGISGFGNQLTQNFDFMQRRQEQAETSQASASFSQMRADYTDQINDGVQKGTLDSQQITDQFDKDVSDQADSYSTPGGKDYFNKQAARLRGSILTKSMHGQSTIAANNAKSDWTNGLTNDTNTVADDPTQFGDVMDSYQVQAGKMVENGAVSDHDSQKMVADAGKKLSQAAVRGIMDSDFNRVTGQAQALLDQDNGDAIPKASALEAAVSGFKSATTKMADGSYDEYLSAGDKKQLASEETQMQSRAVAEINRLVTVKKAAQQEGAQNWGNQAWMDMQNNKLSAKQIQQAPLTWQQKQEWTDMLNRSTEPQKTDPAYYNSIVSRIIAPDGSPNKITDPMSIPGLVRPGKLSTQDAEKLQKFLDVTPAGQALNYNRSQLMKVATGALVKANPMLGEADSKGEYHLSQFTQDLQKQEADLRAQKKPVSSLYDTSSPDYAAAPEKLLKYQRTMQEMMQDDAQRAFGNQNQPVQIHNNPGVDQLKTTPPAKKIPPPGLSLEDFKKWKRDNGG